MAVSIPPPAVAKVTNCLVCNALKFGSRFLKSLSTKLTLKASKATPGSVSTKKPFLPKAITSASVNRCCNNIARTVKFARQLLVKRLYQPQPSAGSKGPAPAPAPAPVVYRPRPRGRPLTDFSSYLGPPRIFRPPARSPPPPPRSPHGRASGHPAPCPRG